MSTAEHVGIQARNLAGAIVQWMLDRKYVTEADAAVAARSLTELIKEWVNEAVALEAKRYRR